MINLIRPGTALLFTLLAADPASAQRIDLVDEAKLPRFDIVSVKPGDPSQVVDKTGLTGSFDAELQYAPATGTRGPTDPAPPGSDGASLFTAVQEQLGLRLEPSKTSIDVLVIDYIERPTPD